MVYELLPPLHAEFCYEVFLNTGKTRIYGRHGGSMYLKNRPIHKKLS